MPCAVPATAFASDLNAIVGIVQVPEESHSAGARVSLAYEHVAPTVK
jgi:hypothetical protein